MPQDDAEHTGLKYLFLFLLSNRKDRAYAELHKVGAPALRLKHPEFGAGHRIASDVHPQTDGSRGQKLNSASVIHSELRTGYYQTVFG